jgi:hypothetical protein
MKIDISLGCFKCKENSIKLGLGKDGAGFVLLLNCSNCGQEIGVVPIKNEGGDLLLRAEKSYLDDLLNKK